MRTVRRVLLAAVLAAAATASAQDVPPPNAPKEVPGTHVTVATEDGLSLAGTHWSGTAQGAPGVVLLHMYKGDRSAWEPLVPYLRERGVDVLAIDLRGHGGSAQQGKKDLAPRVEKRETKLFSEMHRDAIAGVRWLVREGRCDPKRIALAGASVGASVAIDAAQRFPQEVAAVACLTPGAKYLGLDSLAHVKKWPAATPLLLVAHASEADGGARALHALLPASRLVVYEDALPGAAAKDQPPAAHGTRMFGLLPFAERTVASWLSARLGSKADDVVIDGVVATEGPDADPWATTGADVSGEGGGKAWAYRVGRRVVFGGSAPAECKAVRLWMESGTIDALGKLPDDAPKIGFAQCAAVDLATGRVLWLFPRAGADLPPQVRSMVPLAATPAIRVVRGAATTFEGEWYAMRAPGKMADPEAIRFVVTFDAEVPPDPVNDLMLPPDSPRVELTSR